MAPSPGAMRGSSSTRTATGSPATSRATRRAIPRCSPITASSRAPPGATSTGTGWRTWLTASSGNDQYGMLELANCQLAEAQASMTPAQFEAFQYELTDEMVAALEQDIDTNIQTMLLERGYTCDGTAEGVIERYNAEH